jgi:hypothetical protein
MTAVEIAEAPIDVTDDLTRAKEVVAEARSDGHTALIAHTALLTIETLAQQVQQIETQIKTERDEWTDWIRYATERSQEVADDNDWCGVYDATMERLGLPRRQPSEVDIGWWCSVELTMEVDDDKVRDIVREDDIDGDFETLTITQSAVATTSVRVSGSRMGAEGSCVCDDVDSDSITGNLPDWCRDWEIADEGTVYCDECG